MRLPLFIRHPIRWRRCVLVCRLDDDFCEYLRDVYPHLADGIIRYTPGQVYTIKYGAQ